MCIAVPVVIESIESPWAVASSRGVKLRVNIELVPDVKIGDYVLVHAGFAIEKMDESSAVEGLKIWEELRELMG